MFAASGEGALLAFAVAFSPLILLVVLQASDVLMGTLAAAGMRQVNSSASWLGILRKMATLLLVFVGYATQLARMPDGTAVIPSNLDIGRVVAFFFCLPEMISIFENAAKMGIKIPPVFSIVSTIMEQQGNKKG